MTHTAEHKSSKISFHKHHVNKCLQISVISGNSAVQITVMLRNCTIQSVICGTEDSDDIGRV